MILVLGLITSCKKSYFIIRDYPMNTENNKFTFTMPFSEILILQDDSLKVKVGSFYSDMFLSKASVKIKDSLFGSYDPYFNQSFLVSRTDSTYKLDTNLVYASNRKGDFITFPPDGFDIRTKIYIGKFDTVRKSENYTVYTVKDVTNRIPAKYCDYSKSYFFYRKSKLPDYIVTSCENKVINITIISEIKNKQITSLDTTGKYFPSNFIDYPEDDIRKEYEKTFELDNETVQWINNVLK